MTRQRFLQINGELIPANEAALDAVSPIVMPDIKPFKANTGAFIEGRRQWREHLKERNCDELGHSDLRERQAAWEKRRVAFAEKQKLAAKVAQPVEVREDFRAAERSRLAAEVMNRLDGHRNVPRKDVLRLSIQLAKRGRYGSR